MATTPAYKAYTVRKSKDENKKDAWISIGAAWGHRDQKGFDLALDALPVDGHIVLRAYEPNSEKPTSERPAYVKKAPAAGNRNDRPGWKNR